MALMKIFLDGHDAENNFPAKRPILAHYTSIDTLEKILTNNELWLSHPFYMNDIEEFKFGMNQGYNIFCSSKELVDAFDDRSEYFHLIELFKGHFNNYDLTHAFDTYIICFSEHSPHDSDGLLSMWRAYGNDGKGVALVVDTAKINSFNDSPLVISKVQYSSTSDRLKWMKSKIVAIAELIKKSEITVELLHSIATQWLESLKIYSLFTKHSGFEEENEWRIVYMSDRDPRKKLESMLSYTVTNTGIEPKMKLKVNPVDGVIGNQSIANLTDQIIIGPSISSTLVSKSFIRLLEKIGQGDLSEKVYSSSIPFRSR